MNAPVTAQATETARIEAALDALLTASIRDDRERPPSSVGGAIRADVLINEAIERLTTWTPAQREAHALLQRPVSEALRQAVRTLGERLHELGGEDLMLEVCDRVSALDPANEGRRSSIMDHRWDGIGDWYA